MLYILSFKVWIESPVRIESPAQKWYLRAAPISALAISDGIVVVDGMIDSNNTNELMVLLINLGDQAFTIQPGDEVAEILPELVLDVQIMDECNIQSKNGEPSKQPDSPDSPQATPVKDDCPV